MKTKFFNCKIMTMATDTPDIFDGELVVDGDRITFVGKKYKGLVDKEIDCHGGLLMPGFIDMHTHSAMSIFRGIAENVTFESWWQDNMRVVESKATVEDFANGTALSALEYIKSGITTVVDSYMNPENTAKILNKLGVRNYIGVGALSPEDNVSETSLDAEIKRLQKFSLTKPILCAHSVYSIDEYQFGQILKYGKKHKIPFTVHASETLIEVGDCYTRNNTTPIGLLEQYGMFELPCILAHCTHADREDIAKMLQYSVTVASNPASNLKLGSGIAPLTSFIENGVNVTLGTDGPASNDALNMFREMYLACNLQRALLHKADMFDTYEIIKMATVNGAKALQNDEIGVLQQGKKADIILLDLQSVNMFPAKNIVGSIVHSANTSNVDLTMIDGKILYQNGQYTFDTKDIISCAIKSANKFQ